jgi:hypothetical protein
MVLYADWDSENPGNLRSISEQVVKKARAQPRNSVEVNRGSTLYESKHFDEVLKQVGVINSNLEGIIAANEEDARISQHDYDEIDKVERAVDAGREGGDPELRSAYSAALSDAESDAGSVNTNLSGVERARLGALKKGDPSPGVYEYGGPTSRVLFSDGEISVMRRDQLEAQLADIDYFVSDRQSVNELRDVLIRSKKQPIALKLGGPSPAETELLLKPRLARTASTATAATAATETTQPLYGQPREEPRAELPGPQTRRQEGFAKGFAELPEYPVSPVPTPDVVDPATLARLKRRESEVEILTARQAVEQQSALARERALSPAEKAKRDKEDKKKGRGMVGGVEAAELNIGYIHLYKSVVTILSAVANANGSLRRLDMRAVPEADFKSLRSATRHLNDLTKAIGGKNKLTARIDAPLKNLYTALIQKLVTFPNAELGDLTGGRLFGGAGFMPARTTFGPPSRLGGVFDELPRRFY